MEELGGRTWRILLVLVDAGASGMTIARTVADAVNDGVRRVLQVHVADVHDDEVYYVVSQVLEVGVRLWRRQGLQVPDTLEVVFDGA